MSLPDTGTDQTTPAVAVAVVDMDPGNRDRLCAQLGQGATPFGSVEELESRLTGVPVVIVLGPSQAGEDSLVSVAAVLRAHPEVGALLVADELSTSVLQQALRSGVRDVLAKSLGSNNKLNVTKATMVALDSLRTREEALAARGK